MSGYIEVRKSPCATCPYRRDVPSGVWDESEYVRLRKYDGEIAEQACAGATGLFGCHQADGKLCAGWVGHRTQPSDLLAVRLALSAGHADDSLLDYSTSVPLFESGAAAAEHGMREVKRPGQQAVAAIGKLTRARIARGIS